MLRKLIYIFIFSPSIFFSQTKISAKLVDSLTKEPIEFANIGILGKGVGTVSDEKGAFSLFVPDSLSREPIRISVIGYKPKSLPASAFLGKSEIFLAQESKALQEVTVSAAKSKRRIAGNRTRSENVLAGFKKNNLGAELAVKIDIKKPGTQITRFMLNVSKNTLSVNPVFRFNVYKKGVGGAPGENILKQNIIIEPDFQKGFIDVDLTQYNIIVDEDVFISVEWIKDLGNATGLYFSTKLIGSGTYYRIASQADWEHVKGVGLGLHAEILE